MPGDVVADLFATTNGTDADWPVKVIDVYPDDSKDKALQGHQLMANAETFCGRYRKGFSAPESIAKNTVEEYKQSLHGVNHVFKTGHSIMATVFKSHFEDNITFTFNNSAFRSLTGLYCLRVEGILGPGRHWPMFRRIHRGTFA